MYVLHPGLTRSVGCIPHTFPVNMGSTHTSYQSGLWRVEPNDLLTVSLSQLFYCFCLQPVIFSCERITEKNCREERKIFFFFRSWRWFRDPNLLLPSRDFASSSVTEPNPILFHSWSPLFLFRCISHQGTGTIIPGNDGFSIFDFVSVWFLARKRLRRNVVFSSGEKRSFIFNNI